MSFTGIPASTCLRIETIWASVNFDFFMESPSRETVPENSTFVVLRIRGAYVLASRRIRMICSSLNRSSWSPPCPKGKRTHLPTGYTFRLRCAVPEQRIWIMVSYGQAKRESRSRERVGLDSDVRSIRQTVRINSVSSAVLSSSKRSLLRVSTFSRSSGSVLDVRTLNRHSVNSMLNPSV